MWLLFSCLKLHRGSRVYEEKVVPIPSKKEVERHSKLDAAKLIHRFLSNFLNSVTVCDLTEATRTVICSSANFSG
jgi:hypothetical protein